MLTCPKCQFDNPNENKFCQQCGTSLTTKECHQCGTIVELSTEKCSNCGAFTSPGWVALVAPLDPGSEVDITESLDIRKRYQPRSENPLLPTIESESSQGIVALKVWDSQPLEKSNLELLLETQDPRFRESGNSPSSNLEFWQSLGLPEIALPYLVLQESLASIVVGTQDAWVYQGKMVVLIEDRSGLELLTTLWEHSEEEPLLYWMDTMAKLWQELTPVNCRQSLLVKDNLRLDEDQNLCLQRLYSDGEEAPSLVSLGSMWQNLFAETGRTQMGAISELLGQLSQGKMETVEQLRSHLKTLSRQQEPEKETPEEVTQPAATPQNLEKMVYRSAGEDLPTVVLPMQLLSLSDAGITDIGRQRDHNEDHFGIETVAKKQENALGKTIRAKGLYIVCDGMGGHAAGEVASAMAVETLQHYFNEHWPEDDRLPDEETIRQGILAANEKIYQINLQNARSGSGRMGTTLVMLLVQDTNVAIAHVGDSRIYRMTRKLPLQQMTLDHEVGQREILRGVDPEDAYARPDAYQLTQALGPRDNDFVKPDIDFLEVNEDTLLLLCSDGLSDNNLLEKNYSQYLTPLISSRANLEQGLLDLIDFANEHNGHDNITGLVVRIKVRPNADRF